MSGTSRGAPLVSAFKIPVTTALSGNKLVPQPPSGGAVEFVWNILWGGKWVGIRQIGIAGGGRSVGGFGSVSSLPLQDL